MQENTNRFTYTREEFTKVFVEKPFPKYKFYSVAGEQYFKIKTKDMFKAVLCCKQVLGFTIPGVQRAVYIEAVYYK